MMKGTFCIGIFEEAASICGYTLFRIHLGGQPYVRYAEGFVPIVKKRTVNGNRQNVVKRRKVRWNDAGHCYSAYSAKRYRQYDLPLSTVYADRQRKEVEDVCR